MKPPTTIEDVLSRVDTNADGGCWLWTGAISSAGYGVTSHQRKNVLVHRLIYEYFIGPIPDGLHIDHLCRVRACCKPSHLDPVSLAENNRRAGLLDRTGRCRAGIHSMTKPDAILIGSDGRRTCRECHKAAKRRYYQRLKARTSDE